MCSRIHLLPFMLMFTLILMSSFFVPCSLQAQSRRAAVIPAFAKKTADLFEEFPTPQPGDWQYENQEPGQTFAQYLRSQPVTATKQRHTLYIQTLGELTPKQQEIVEKAREFLAIFYGLEVKELPSLPDSVLPEKARRIQPGTTDNVQYNVLWILEKVMQRRLPKDAAAYLMFTAADLWPGNDWNFCFGYATYRMRIGAWSLARNGNPDDLQEYSQVLRRTLRLAAHETGHMFSIQHCIAARCCMNGCNSLEESDGMPLEFCPECQAKLFYATKFKFRKRWESLEAFYTENALSEEAAFMRECLDAQ